MSNPSSPTLNEVIERIMEEVQGEKTLSQLFKLKEGENCSKFEKRKKNPHFDEISKELTSNQGE